ncbi:hypothetical protein ACFRJ8_12050 [Arthrobacter sp. NPDC056886]|uniref:hypothetical protein n=1 Tax=Arthrobacter sp. NPDC056886 TaxID=3345960 RepID=UPI00366BFE6D
MTMPLQLRISIDRESVAMGDDVVSYTREVSIDEGTPPGVMMHRSAICEVRGPGAC